MHKLKKVSKKAGGTPFSSNQILGLSYLLMYQINSLGLACDDWDDKPQAEKIWTNFKIYFTTAHRCFRSSQEMRQGFGYQNQNNLQAKNMS